MTNRLFISLDFPPENGGIQNYVYGIVSHLEPTETIVLTSNRIGKELYMSFDRAQSFKIYRVGINNKVSFLKQVFQLLILLFYVIILKKKHKTEELHFGNIMPIGLIAPILTKILKVKFYPYIHGLDFLESQKSVLKYKLLTYCLKNATKIICNSNYTRNVLMEAGIKGNNIKVIHPGIPEKNPSIRINKEEVIDKYKLKDKQVLITVGRLVKRKGHDKVIESLKVVVQEFPNLKYIICGKGPEEETLRNLVKKNNLEAFVIFTGDIERSELEVLYSISDLFIMLNREILEEGDVEGYGIVFLEAGIHKLPVIGGNNGGVPDAIIDGKTGYLINSTNIKEIVNTISSFFYDKDLTNQMGENGYKWVTENCLWDHRVKLLKNLDG